MPSLIGFNHIYFGFLSSCLVRGAYTVREAIDAHEHGISGHSVMIMTKALLVISELLTRYQMAFIEFKTREKMLRLRKHDCMLKPPNLRRKRSHAYKIKTDGRKSIK